MAVLFIVAGPNGSGKSTLVADEAGQTVLKQFGLTAVDILNADERAKELAAGGPVTPEINLQAAKEIDAVVNQAIADGRSIGVETVLSSQKYLASADAARAKDYLVAMTYVCVKNDDMNVARVQTRVQDGGHAVPEDRIRVRRQRSIETLGLFIPKLDLLLVFDNSNVAGPLLIAIKQSLNAPVQMIEYGAIPDLEGELKKHTARKQKARRR